MTDTTVSLPVRETLKTAWSKVKGSKGVIWGVLATVFAITFGLGILIGIAQATGITQAAPAAGIPFFLKIVLMIMNLLMGTSLMYIGIQRALELPIHYRMITYSFNFRLILCLMGFYLLSYLISFPFVFLVAVIEGTLTQLQQAGNPNMLTFILLVGCEIILAVVWFYLQVRLYLGWGLIVDKKVNPWQALTLSFKATRGHFWGIVGVAFSLTFIMLISIIPLGIGLIWSIPFVVVTYGEVYKRLITLRKDTLVSL